MNGLTKLQNVFNVQSAEEWDEYFWSTLFQDVYGADLQDWPVSETVKLWLKINTAIPASAVVKSVSGNEYQTLKHHAFEHFVFGKWAHIVTLQDCVACKVFESMMAVQPTVPQLLESMVSAYLPKEEVNAA